MKVYLLGFVALAAVGVLTWSHTAAYQYGRSTEQARIASQITRENANAGKAAEKWRAELRRCNAVGGLFDFETGACQH
jgi:cytochrome c-type biogenesis protein CcmH/NrfG